MNRNPNFSFAAHISVIFRAFSFGQSGRSQNHKRDLSNLTGATDKICLLDINEANTC